MRGDGGACLASSARVAKPLRISMAQLARLSSVDARVAADALGGHVWPPAEIVIKFRASS